MQWLTELFAKADLTQIAIWCIVAAGWALFTIHNLKEAFSEQRRSRARR